MNWYNTSWEYRAKLTINSSEVDSTIANFPVYVNLADMPAGFWDNVKSDGGDIRVTQSDGTTECPVEIVAIDTGAETGELHFKANSLSSSADTDFYIYYGNASASLPAVTATYGRNAVWSDYLAVFHLQETANNDAGGYIDSTGNGYDGTGASMSINSNGYLAGKGAETDGTSDYITTGVDLSSKQELT